MVVQWQGASCIGSREAYVFFNLSRDHGGLVKRTLLKSVFGLMNKSYVLIQLSFKPHVFCQTILKAVLKPISIIIFCILALNIVFPIDLCYHGDE